MDARRLKSSILQFAMQGKLVVQNPQDQPVSALIHAIKLEQEQLIKEKVIKKEKPLPPISKDEIPFEIPDSWKWVRLGELAYISSGSTPLKSNIDYYKNGDIPWCTSTVTGLDKVLMPTTFITSKAVSECSLKIYPRGTLIMAMYGQGKTRGQVTEVDFGFTINQACAAIELYSETTTNKDYIRICLEYIYNSIRVKSAGGAQPNLNLLKVKSILIPLPPINEQIAIVRKISQLLDKISDYNMYYEELNRINNIFPENLEKSILQYAMQGKLVEQTSQDQPANILINAIKFEKEQLIKEKVIKKERPLLPISEAEIPFEIPSTWEWVRLGEIYYNHGQKKPDNLFEYIDVAAIDNNFGKISGELNVLEAYEAPSRARKIVKKGDIIYSTVRPYLKNIAIVDREFNYEAIASTAFIVMTTKLDSEYLFYLLRSPMFDQQVTENMKGVAYPAINDTAFNNLIIPVPPLEEQKRIVKKIKALLKLKNTLIFLN